MGFAAIEIINQLYLLLCVRFSHKSVNRSLFYLVFFHAEQQEQLKLMNEKFKEQVNQHLQDCRSTFEGLEAQQLEFKGNVEKQSMLSFVALYVHLFSSTVYLVLDIES